jgi:hypothetical protein
LAVGSAWRSPLSVISGKTHRFDAPRAIAVRILRLSALRDCSADAFSVRPHFGLTESATGPRGDRQHQSCWGASDVGTPGIASAHSCIVTAPSLRVLPDPSYPLRELPVSPSFLPIHLAWRTPRQLMRLSRRCLRLSSQSRVYLYEARSALANHSSNTLSRPRSASRIPPYYQLQNLHKCQNENQRKLRHRHHQ